MMLSWEEWQEKAESSLEAARILLKNGKPVEAVNRAYYATYQMVTGTLIKIGQTPRSKFGNWTHQETQLLFKNKLCRHRRLFYKDRTLLKSQLFWFKSLLVMRRLADYGDSRAIGSTAVMPLVRASGRLVHLLKRFIERGLL